MKKYLTDPSAWTLLLVNVVAGYYAISQNQSIWFLLEIYWIQSVVIVLFLFIKTVTYRRQPRSNLEMENNNVLGDGFIKLYCSVALLGYCGMALFMYLIFISFGAVNFTSIRLEEILGNLISTPGILLVGVLFFLNHLFSYWFNSGKDEFHSYDMEYDLNIIMKQSTLRLLPMHLSAMLGFPLFLLLPRYTTISILFLIIIKTIVDIKSHFYEHIPPSNWIPK